MSGLLQRQRSHSCPWRGFFILRGCVFHCDTALTGDNLHTQCVFYIIVNGVGRNLGGQTVNKLCQK